METLLDDESRKHLSERFEKELKGPVKVAVFVKKDKKSEFCEFSEQLLQELHELEPEKITYEVFDIDSELAKELNIFGTPSLFIGYDKGYKLGYRGAPLGYEAASLIESIIMVSKGESGLNPKSKELIKQISKPVKIDVYVTPTCPYCPRAVMLAHQIGVEAKGLVEANMIEAQENMDLARRFNVSSVPQQVINDDMGSISIGVQPEAKFVAQVVEYGKA